MNPKVAGEEGSQPWPEVGKYSGMFQEQVGGRREWNREGEK